MIPKTSDRLKNKDIPTSICMWWPYIELGSHPKILKCHVDKNGSVS